MFRSGGRVRKGGRCHFGQYSPEPIRIIWGLWSKWCKREAKGRQKGVKRALKCDIVANSPLKHYGNGTQLARVSRSVHNVPGIPECAVLSKIEISLLFSLGKKTTLKGRVPETAEKWQNDPKSGVFRALSREKRTGTSLRE